ncbi:DUF4012 domain-containing protein [Streptomyces sp. NBC_01353]|uniref:DUF4012 domain-containing protein n=1 Tax=Streptomyces sp. NBC_01353 TaxID=2903835 RepID=UPI002E327982|nr:DUF4012 domain-containing protein [Streptomyces sp. NBC_01353]
MTFRKRPESARDAHRERRRVHGPRGKYVLSAAAALSVAAGAWIGITGWMARDELLAAQGDLNALRESLATAVARDGAPAVAAGSAGESDQERLVRSAADHAERAHDLTTGPAWYAVAQLPFVGEPFRTVRGVARASDGLAGDVLPPLVRAFPRLKAGAQAGGMSRVLSELERQAPAFDRAGRVAAGVQEDTRRLPGSTWLPAVDRARAQLARQLDRLVSQTDDAAFAARTVPPLLGAHGPRRYILVFQNTAEARGTGGLPGAFAVLRADRGRLAFERFGNDTDMDGVRADVNLGTEFAAMYGNNAPGRLFVNSNMSPHFPYAARLWTAYGEKLTGQRLDGAIATDPAALGLLLRATGPVDMPDGTTITADNAVDITERTSYVKYSDFAQRKAFFIEVARAAAMRLMNGIDDPQGFPALLSALDDVQDEGRVQMWSAHPAEQRLLAARPLGGVVPDAHGPFAGLVVNNAAGSKLDYYLDRSLVWAPGACTDTGRSVTATVSLTSRAPASKLPAYVTTRADAPPYPTRPGDNRLLVSYYAGSGASLTGATLDGRPVKPIPGFERGHPTYTLDLELPRQTSRTLVLHLIEPEADSAPKVLRQALVTPLRTTVEPARPCRG